MSHARLKQDASTRRASGHERGFTMLEMVVATSIFAIAFVLVGSALQRSTEDVNGALQSGELDASLRRVVLQISHELQNSGFANGIDYVISHPQGATTQLKTVQFRVRSDIEGLDSDWELPVSYKLAAFGNEIPGDGLDNDSDGITDERALYRVEEREGAADRVTVVCDNVMALSFSRNDGDDYVTFSITIARLGADRKSFTRTVVTSVAFLNRFEGN